MHHNSYHNPILLCYNQLKIVKPKPFRFHSMWINSPTFHLDVKSFWSFLNFSGNPMAILMCKLKSLWAFLRSWNKSTFGHVDTNISSAKQYLINIQRNIDDFRFSEDLHS